MIEDLVQARLDQEPFPIVYADMRQVLAARALMPKALQLGQGLSGFPTIAVRTRDAWQPLAGELRPLVRAIDPAVGVDAIAPLDDLRLGSLVRPRFYAVLLGLFAAIAGILAAIGVYGVLAYIVVQRSHEIGVRMALGAPRVTVLYSVMVRGLTLTGVGVIAGLAGAVAVTRYLASMLFALTPLDGGTFAAVAGAFVVVAALACYLPARRATRVDPGRRASGVTSGFRGWVRRRSGSEGLARDPFSIQRVGHDVLAFSFCATSCLTRAASADCTLDVPGRRWRTLASADSNSLPFSSTIARRTARCGSVRRCHDSSKII